MMILNLNNHKKFDRVVENSIFLYENGENLLIVPTKDSFPQTLSSEGELSMLVHFCFVCDEKSSQPKLFVTFLFIFMTESKIFKV